MICVCDDAYEGVVALAVFTMNRAMKRLKSLDSLSLVIDEPAALMGLDQGVLEQCLQFNSPVLIPGTTNLPCRRLNVVKQYLWANAKAGLSPLEQTIQEVFVVAKDSIVRVPSRCASSTMDKAIAVE